MAHKISDPHPQYIDIQPDYELIRAVVSGQRAMHEAGEQFLPMLSGMDKDDYAAYVARADFYNGTQRTVDGLSGMVFRRLPSIELPDSLRDIELDADLSGLPLLGFMEMMVEEILELSRAGILVDFPESDGNTRSTAQARAQNMRPFFTLYKAEQIFNWRRGIINGRNALTEVRLMETGFNDAGDEVPQIRQLHLVEGTYTQSLYRKNNEGEWALHRDVIPLANGAAMDFIPFVFTGIQDTSPSVDKPAILDLANINVAHYQITADLRHGAHFTALPTPVITGADPDTELKIGSAVAWVLESSEADAKMLEFSGAGLSSLRDMLKDKESQMASLGARMLAPEKAQAEAAETHSIKRMGENSVLASIVNSCEMAINKAVQYAGLFMGTVVGDESITMNRDFMPYNLSPEMLARLMELLQRGKVSRDSFHYNLSRAELLPPGRTLEMEQDLIETDMEEEATGQMGITIMMDGEPVTLSASEVQALIEGRSSGGDSEGDDQ